MKTLAGLLFLAAVPLAIFVDLALLPLIGVILIVFTGVPSLTSPIGWKYDKNGQISATLGLSGAAFVLSGWASHLLDGGGFTQVLLAMGAVLTLSWIGYQFVRDRP